VGFPIGVPASVLTATAEWIDYYARRGFNVLTYKTVRSAAYPAHSPPNWLFLTDLDTPIDPDDGPIEVVGDPTVWPRDSRSFSMANSFGVPSVEPEEWTGDIRKALSYLRPNQLLIVSVMGYWEKYAGAKLVKDFVDVAVQAAAIGAPAIELNLSCPNSVDPETGEMKDGLICESAEMTTEIVNAVSRSLPKETRLVIKLSYMERDKLTEVVLPLARERLIHGISAINTVPMEVRTPSGEHAFPGRHRAGVSGIAIREFGHRTVRWLAELRDQHDLVYDIIAMGGVMTPSDVEEYLKLGANAVQSATAAFYNPALAEETLMSLGGAPIPDEKLEASSRVLELIGDQPMTLDEIAQRVEALVTPRAVLLERTLKLLQNLEREGHVVAERDRGTVTFRAVQREPELVG
jgi:dihydroorotate dehydrogenase